MRYEPYPRVVSRPQQVKDKANLGMSYLRDHGAKYHNPDILATMVFAEVKRDQDGIKSYYLGKVSLNALWVCVDNQIIIPTLEPVTELKRPPCELIFKENTHQISVQVTNAMSFEPIIGKEQLYEHIFAKESRLGPRGASALMAEAELMIASSDHEVM